MITGSNSSSGDYVGGSVRSRHILPVRGFGNARQESRAGQPARLRRLTLLGTILGLSQSSRALILGEATELHRYSADA